MLKKGLYSGFALIIINKHLYIFHDKYRVTHHHYTIHTYTGVYISVNIHLLCSYLIISKFKFGISEKVSKVWCNGNNLKSLELEED